MYLLERVCSFLTYDGTLTVQQHEKQQGEYEPPMMFSSSPGENFPSVATFESLHNGTIKLFDRSLFCSCFGDRNECADRPPIQKTMSDKTATRALIRISLS
jgi:hypothetical protein